MELFALLLWLGYMAVLLRLSVRGREMVLLGAWGLLALPLIASLGRLLLQLLHPII